MIDIGESVMGAAEIERQRSSARDEGAGCIWKGVSGENELYSWMAGEKGEDVVEKGGIE